MSHTDEFFELCIGLGVLRFGRFTLKSGRESPYFFNSGLFNTGSSLARLAGFYAQAIVDSGIAFDGLFGPAYKGIPLVAAVSMAMAALHGRDMPYSFNRKQAKGYGEGGSLIGAPLKGRILIVDDVITAGTAIRESVDIIRAAGAEPVGVAIALDRQERGQESDRSAVQEVEARFGLRVIPVARLADLMNYVSHQPARASVAADIEAYRQQYGIGSRAAAAAAAAPISESASEVVPEPVLEVVPAMETVASEPASEPTVTDSVAPQSAATEESPSAVLSEIPPPREVSAPDVTSPAAEG